jgi:hypothetical protein
LWSIYQKPKTSRGVFEVLTDYGIIILIMKNPAEPTQDSPPEVINTQQETGLRLVPGIGQTALDGNINPSVNIAQNGGFDHHKHFPVTKPDDLPPAA